METVITTTPDPSRLRAAMVGSLTAGGHLRTPEIISAFTETERHLFLPCAASRPRTTTMPCRSSTTAMAT